MVALTTLALRSDKKLFQKGNLKTKNEALCGANVRTRSIGLDPSFRIRFAKIQR